jgi:hypothetical protein
MKIVISEPELARRSREIRRILAPISKVDSGPATKPISSQGVYIIATYDGCYPTVNFRDWRFRLKKKNLSAGYFEVWKDPLRDGKWHLEKAYLHIYEVNPGTRGENELICLHCDPSESVTADHYCYKVGPHIHINNAPQPFPHSHFALNRCHLPEILSSLSALTKAFSMGIDMIKDQVLDAM